jgi:peptidoglycan/LPS O-acetylase OafA/YrhL
MSMVASSAVGDVAGAPDATPAYRPHLDGLRAVAVYLVLLFHAGSDRFSGGYIGVDVFFVLSGFLVTQLLLRDIARNGSIRLGRFYSRRFRRLLPAAFVVLVVTAIVYSAIASPAEVADAVGSFKAAFLYSTNWYFIHHATGYFGADITADPVLHFWSLAVEEQFYLLWPLTLAGAFAFTRRMDRARQLRVIGIVVGVGALASAAWALSLRNADPNRAYYGTDTRAYELFAGALIALVPAVIASAQRFRPTMRIATSVSILALLVLASSWVHLDAIERGIVVTISTVVLIVALETAEGGVVKRVLSTRFMTQLGRISYGTYLWHWLVILVTLKAFHPGTTATIGIAFLVSTALAALSYDMMEHPVRTSKRLDRFRGPVIALGLTVSVVSALVVVPRILDRDSGAVTVAAASSTRGVAPVPAGLNWRAIQGERREFHGCLARRVEDCVLVRGTGATVAVIGDSHALMLVAPFVGIAKRENWTLGAYVQSACPWQEGIYRFTVTTCLAHQADLRNRIIPRLDPDVVVLIGAPLDHEFKKGLQLRGPGGALETGSRAAAQAIDTAADETVARLRRDGREVVMIEPIPQAPIDFDPLACLSKARYLDECRFVVSAKPSENVRHYRRLARTQDHVWSLDISKLICPYDPICDPVVNGTIVWKDTSHISDVFSKQLIAPIRTLFTENGIGTR